MGLMNQESRDSMIRMIEDQTRDMFKESPFQEYLKSRLNLNFESLDEVINRNRGFVKFKLASKKKSVDSSHPPVVSFPGEL